MDWLRRVGQRRPEAEPQVAAAPPPAPPGIEGAAPGISSILKAMPEDGAHAILDLGAASDGSLRTYARFARWVRFADLLGGADFPRGTGQPMGPLDEPLPPPPRPYDVVFAWDILDRLYPAGAPRVVEWMIGALAPDARVHVVVRASETAVMRPLRFTLLDVDRIRIEERGATPLPPSRLLPADVAKLLAPLHVLHAFNLKSGLREYVAARR